MESVRRSEGRGVSSDDVVTETIHQERYHAWALRCLKEQKFLCEMLLEKAGLTREQVIAHRRRHRNGTFEDKRMV